MAESLADALALSARQAGLPIPPSISALASRTATPAPDPAHALDPHGQDSERPDTTHPTGAGAGPEGSDTTHPTPGSGAGAQGPIVLADSATVRRTNTRRRDRRGRTPYGFLWGPLGLVPDPQEYPVWQAIIELGRRGHSSEEIARRLQRLDVPTRHDRIWHASTVTNILRREDPTLAPSRYDEPLPNPDRRERMRRSRQRRRATRTGEPAGQVPTGA